MAHINIEIKAKSVNLNIVRDILKSNNAVFIGIDHQIDTYFNVNNGRLKLRGGKIENHLIHYKREDNKAPKQSEVTLFESCPESSLKEILTAALGVLTIVDKKREIFFIDNVKFHIDTVKDLGTFVEIEAIDSDGAIGGEKLLAQCRFFIDLLAISENDLIADSYSDLLLQKKIGSAAQAVTPIKSE